MSYELSYDYEAMYHGAINAGIQYLLKHKSIKTMVIGVSGGIDSAVICMLARAICDKLVDRNVTLIGRSISIESNTADEEERARGIGEHFCHEFKHKNSLEGWRLFANGIERGLGSLLPNADDKKLKIRAGNTKARYRMAYLYNLASKHDGMVLGTDNLTEYMLGFWTLHGDVGDFGLIQNLWKTEVYGLADWWIIYGDTSSETVLGSVSMSRCVNAVPTDGLGITDSDLDQLLPAGYTNSHGRITTQGNDFNHIDGYKCVDTNLINYLLSPQPANPYIKYSVIRRHLQTEFKRNNPASIDRNLLVT